MIPHPASKQDTLNAGSNLRLSFSLRNLRLPASTVAAPCQLQISDPVVLTLFLRTGLPIQTIQLFNASTFSDNIQVIFIRIFESIHLLHYDAVHWTVENFTEFVFVERKKIQMHWLTYRRGVLITSRTCYAHCSANSHNVQSVEVIRK